ncbi:hypothetical protein D9M70_579770 [compost metagenome]
MSGHEDSQDSQQAERDQEGHRHTQDCRISGESEEHRKVGKRFAPSETEADATQEDQRRQCRDEGVKPKIDYEHPVKRADQCADREYSGQRQDRRVRQV